ncbi:MAG: hypothetical protein A2V74_00325 [Acidobacteria bacterium RBG_16_70_10]|nr:MAG: hypothetical protein A2V74_00325 [Acidobacteria bacterium RBG_16_70_10]
MKRSIGWTLVVAVLALPRMASTQAGSSAKGETSRQRQQIRFYDVRQQTEEFIAYNKWISLTPEEQRIKTQAPFLSWAARHQFRTGGGARL